MNELHEDFISVIIPTYKRSAYLKRAVDSVLSQTYNNIEVIIVDDNGKNGYAKATEELVKTLYGDDRRVRCIKNVRNLGSARARNCGAEAAYGDYLCFLDKKTGYLIQFNNLYTWCILVQMFHRKIKRCKNAFK